MTYSLTGGQEAMMLWLDHDIAWALDLVNKEIDPERGYAYRVGQQDATIKRIAESWEQFKAALASEVDE